MGQQTAFAGSRGELALRQPQNKHIVRVVQPHFASTSQHHGVQRLGDVSQIRSAEQQAEQVLVLRHRDGLFPQQAGHLVE